MYNNYFDVFLHLLRYSIKKKVSMEKVPKIVTLSLPEDIRDHLKSLRGIEDRGAIQYSLRELIRAGISKKEVQNG